MYPRLFESLKVDAGLKPQTLTNTNVTGAYHPMENSAELLAVLKAGAMAAATTLKLELIQATDAAGTDAELIATKTATATANALVNKATLTLSTVLATHTVTINGLVFTAHATVTTLASRQFSISGDDTADAVALASCINDPDYGVPGVLAAAAAAVITLTSLEPGEVTITASSTGATITVATVEAVVQVALLAEEMKVNDGFTHVAAKVTTTATTVVDVTIIRCGNRYTPTQACAASAA
jgi:hypothetical protein